MSARNALSFVYKVLPHPAVNSIYYFPVPIPASHEFYPTEADAKDGFTHLSKADQVAGVLNRFFADVDKVTLLKVDYPRLSGFKIVKWEQAGSGQEFPHLYARLEGEYIDSFKELAKKQGERNWDDVLEHERQSGWLQ